MNYRPALTDIAFTLDHVVKWKPLCELPAFAHVDPDLARAVLIEGARFASTVLSPLNAPGDEQGAHLHNGQVITPHGFQQAFRVFVDGGWPGIDLPQAYGGQSLPLVLQVAFSEMVNGACVSFGMMPIMMRAGSWLLIDHAEAALRDRIVPELVAGRWGATICITEPQAGSNVSRLRTCARPDGNRYLLSGEKIFITYADQDFTDQIVHFVLARTTDAAPDSSHLSVFVVPKRRFEDGLPNGISVTRVEKKMGLKASPTCALRLDGAVGYRVGSIGKGLDCMFSMVNLMRLEVATQGVGVASAALQKAVEYALQRTQGGRPGTTQIPIIRHLDIRRILGTMRARVDAMRALTMTTAYHLDVARNAEDAAMRAASQELAGFLLPVCKTAAAEMAFEVASNGIQVFGGHGYLADARIEQHCRDARVMSIYEGTSGIQALDLVYRKLIRDDGAGYRLLSSAIRRDLEGRSDAGELAEIRGATVQGLKTLDEASCWLLSRAALSRTDIEVGAYDYLHLVALVSGAWMWLRMASAEAQVCPSSSTRRALARWYARYLMPELGVRAAHVREGTEVLEQLDDVALAAGLLTEA